MTLIGSQTSPYVRKLRLFFITQKIDFDFKSINYLDEKDARYLLSINPLNQIPVLLIDGHPLYDSRVIFNRYNTMKLSPSEENILSAIDTALDSAINLFSLKRGGMTNEEMDRNTYVLRQRERITHLLAYLEEKFPYSHTHWDYLSMSLYSFLDWGQFRELIHLEPYQKLLAFLEREALRPGIKETNPRITT